MDSAARQLLSVTNAHRIRIEVSDSRGHRFPGEPRHGLLIVEALAEEWGTCPGPAPRKSVWAELISG
ncbi:hypothetical protein [Streptomyces sp. NPDC091371]|uniref:hypothetical protein n=1 Tax=Streptomyces sp. NPDC091371 TaxID=3155303 RepID=UPI00342F4A83